jgi:hypothetical protein
MNVGPFAGDRSCLCQLIEGILWEYAPSVSTLSQLHKLDMAFFIRNGIHMTYCNIGDYEQKLTHLFM